MERVLANLAGGVGEGGGPALLSGNGKDETHLLVVCTGRARPVRRVQLGHRAPRARAHQFACSRRRARRSRFVCVGKKGYDQLRRQYEPQIIELIDLRGVRQLGFSHADEIGRKVIATVRGRRVRRVRRCSSRASNR
jgi:F-type H+-transporting ATPase subunit gamma